MHILNASCVIYVYIINVLLKSYVIVELLSEYKILEVYSRRPSVTTTIVYYIQSNSVIMC
jgi:hypothetical protein